MTTELTQKKWWLLFLKAGQEEAVEHLGAVPSPVEPVAEKPSVIPHGFDGQK